MLLSTSLVTGLYPDYASEESRDDFLADYDPYVEGDPRLSEDVAEQDAVRKDAGRKEEEAAYLEDNQTYDPAPAHVYPADMKQQRWANAAYAFVKSIECKEAGNSHLFTSNKECKALQRLRKADMNVYLADPTGEGLLEAVLPDDDELGGGGELGHDAVIVLDPYPTANFGHLVVVMFLDFNVEENTCHQMNGQRLGECSFYY